MNREKLWLDLIRMLLVYTRSTKYSLKLQVDYGLLFLGECAEFKTNVDNYSFKDSIPHISATEYIKLYPLA